MRYATDIIRIIAKGYFWMIFEFDNGFIGKVDFTKPTVNLRELIMKKENFDKIKLYRGDLLLPFTRKIGRISNYPVMFSAFDLINMSEPVDEDTLAKYLSGNTSDNQTK